MAILGFITGYQNDSSLMKEILVGVMTSENTFLIGVIALMVFLFPIEKNLL